MSIDENGDMPGAQDPDENGDFECPVCQDYSGPRQSVEAHITGKSDDKHKGKTGLQFRVTGPNGEQKVAMPDGGTEQDGDGSNHSQAQLDAGLPNPEPDPDETGVETEPDEIGVETEPDETDVETEPDETDSNGSGILFLAVLGVVIYLARKTGNENQMRDRIEGV